LETLNAFSVENDLSLHLRVKILVM